jgi:hypothetical protein
VQVSGDSRVSASVTPSRDCDPVLPFVCECGDVGCDKCVPMTASEYEELPPEQPGLALAPGHELEEKNARV